MKYVIEIEWNGPANVDNPQHWEELKEHGAKRAAEMIQEGYVAGELALDIADADTDEETSYRGWWTTKSEEES